jgi:hypothetical protein
MRIAMLLLFCAGMLAGCGGMPKPMVQGQKPRAGQTLVRVAIVPTNYDESWDRENVRVQGFQEWLNDDGVPAQKGDVFDQRLDKKQGITRGTIMMKELDGDETAWVRLKFQVVSGENEASENFSGGATTEWKMPSDLEQKDIIFLVVLSRKARDSYAIDVLYALDPATGAMEQVLPSGYEN